MTEDDPLPLKAGRNAPPELVRALRALGKRDRDSARLARVADKLGALLDAPPPAPTTGWRKLLGSKTGITGIVVGLGGLGLLAYQLATGSPDPSLREPPAPQPATQQPTAAVSPASPPPTAASDLPQAAPPAAPNSRRPRRSAAPTRAAAHAPAQSPQATARTEPAPAVTVSPEPAKEPAPMKEPSPVEPEPEAQKAQEVEQRSEVQLLSEARKALPAQPAAALRLLDEHVARFRTGQLAPEREVLAIEALRKLGRYTEASQRLRQFQSRYPNSIHLRRLQDKI
jgi:hypothetical protein